ncbi:unnamed protein product, partial [Meganyctiphanes norvegica]
MTTRRRRAGSETSPEEQQFLITTAEATQQPQQPQQQSFTLLNQDSCHNSCLYPKMVSIDNVPGWGHTTNNSNNTAYYKKTDTVKPPLGNPSVIPRPTPGSYNQYWAAPQNSPSVTQVLTPNPVGPTTLGHWNGSATGSQSVPWSPGAHSTGSWTSGKAPSGSFQSFSTFSSSGSLSSLDEGDMASRDRTTEFTRIWRSQQGGHPIPNGGPHQSKRPQDMRQYGEFMQKSRLIGRHISSTYAKLEKMTHLAKKRSLFDDSHDREMQELTGIIRHDLTSLTKQLEDLRNRSSRADYTNNNNNNNHIKKHSHNLVGSLQTKVAGITQAFKDVLEIRTENLKMQHERREQFTGDVVNGDFAPGAMTGHHQGSVLLADEAASANGAVGGYGGGGNSDVSINMGAAASGQYSQQLMLMEEQDTYLQSRADTMKTIESTIVELGSMFSQLATMVKEQEELVHRIDANVEDAEMNVEAAHTELLKYFKSVSSNRMLMFKVFGIMIVFFVIFVVFMA